MVIPELSLESKIGNTMQFAEYMLYNISFFFGGKDNNITFVYIP